MIGHVEGLSHTCSARLIRFLVGRQFCVILVVYLTAQITTFPSLPDMVGGHRARFEPLSPAQGLPRWLFFLLIETGLPGVLVLLAFGQVQLDSLPRESYHSRSAASATADCDCESARNDESAWHDIRCGITAD